MSLSKTIRSIKQAEKSPLLMTPRIEKFLRENPEGMILDEAGMALFQQIAAATFGSNSDRSGRFGSSSRGTCLRAQMFKFLGMPELKVIDTDLMNLFADGKWRHIRWQMMGVQSGALTHAEYPLEYKKYRMKSSADGLNSREAFLFELKGDRNLSRLMDLDGAVDPKHNLQIHSMFLMTGWDVCAYVMEDKASQNFREVIVRRDPKIINEVRKELEELNEHVENRTLPEVLPACAAKEGPYRSCPFAKQCLDRAAHGDYWPDIPGDWDS